MKNILKIGLPKGSLQDSTINLFARAGYDVLVSPRSYFPQVNDPHLSIVLFRAQ